MVAELMVLDHISGQRKVDEAMAATRCAYAGRRQEDSGRLGRQGRSAPAAPVLLSGYSYGSAIASAVIAQLPPGCAAMSPC